MGLAILIGLCVILVCMVLVTWASFELGAIADDEEKAVNGNPPERESSDG